MIDLSPAALKQLARRLEKHSGTEHMNDEAASVLRAVSEHFESRAATPGASMFPGVHGKCPACRGSLFLGDGGHVTCSNVTCENPTAAGDMLSGPRVDLASIAARVGAWRHRNFGEQSRVRNALQIAEECGEVARAVGKADEGIRPETRGNLADELGDVILATCGMANAEVIDLEAVVSRRLARMEGLDFTKDANGGEVTP